MGAINLARTVGVVNEARTWPVRWQFIGRLCFGFDQGAMDVRCKLTV